MDATTTRSTTLTLASLRRDFPDITFLPGETFRWAPDLQTIYYENLTDTASLLHEIAHALLGHSAYTRDIELLKMESEAWDYVTSTLAPEYQLPIDLDQVEDMIDTYRNWLHSRSTCPRCDATGLQTTANSYSCLACQASWRVNEAKSCALRRYQIVKQK